MKFIWFYFAIFILIILVLFIIKKQFFSNVIIIKDISYGSHEKQKLDLCRPKYMKDKLPAVILIHGGGGDKKSYSYACRRLAESGYIAITINWREEPEPFINLAIEDAKLASAWLHNREEVDPNRVAAIGGSGGGALSSLLGTMEFDYKVKCVINQFGPTDFTDPTLHNMSFWTDNVFPRAFKVTYQQDPELYYKSSPIAYVSANDADFIFTRSVNDKLVPKSQAERMIAALRNVGKDVPDLYEFYGTGLAHALQVSPSEAERIWNIEKNFLYKCLNKIV